MASSDWLLFIDSKYVMVAMQEFQKRKKNQIIITIDFAETLRYPQICFIVLARISCNNKGSSLPA